MIYSLSSSSFSLSLSPSFFLLTLSNVLVFRVLPAGTAGICSVSERQHTHTVTDTLLRDAKAFVLWRLQQRSLPLRGAGNGCCRSERVQLGGEKLRWAVTKSKWLTWKTEFRKKSYVVCVSDYKSNLLREKAHMSPQPKVIDLDRGSRRASPCWFLTHNKTELTQLFSFHRNAEIR